MQTIGVNIVPGNFPQFVRYSQNDIGREFKINVVDFDIPSGATVECVATKPSGLGFTVSGTVTDNTVTFVTTAIMTDEWGKFPAELRISSGGEVLGTANFMFIGERNPHPEGTTDGQQGTIIPELTLLVNEIRESNAQVAEMTASAHTSDVPTAEYDAETNNLEFGIPSIPEEEFLKAFVTDSASGSIASITDGGDGLPVKSLNVSIVPKQSGSGDPSPDNIRPISGYDEVIISNSPYGSSYPNPITGKNKFKGNSFGTITPCRIEYGQDFVASASASCGIRWYDANKVQIDYWSSLPNTSADGRKWRTYRMDNQGGCYYFEFYGSGAPTDFMVELGTTPSPYEPYGTSYPISLPSTVYGGTLEVMSGKLTINAVKVDMGAFNWAYVSTYDIFYATLYPQPLASVVPSSTWYAVCECYKYQDNILTTNRAMDKVCEMGRTGYYINDILVRDTTFGTSASDFKASVNGKYLVYKLINPTTITLTPTQVETLLGNNNIYSSCGDVEVEYRADTKLYIDKLLGNARTLSMAMAPAPETTEETEDDQR